MAAIKFLGCSVVRFNSNIGWGETPSTCTITLVEDAINGDNFFLENSPDVGVGSPYTFTFGDYTFRGLLQTWRKKNGQDGNPLYEVTLSDPREILVGVQIVTGGYYSVTSMSPNVLNPFGYLENQQFGTSYSNDNGMPWRTLYPMVVDMANDTVEFKTFGAGLKYKDVQYRLDISELEPAPFFYRIRGNPSVSLMDMINQRCTDAGLDYVIDLQEDNTIRIRTISRKRQISFNNGPNSGSINRYLESRSQVTNKSRGWELRNDGPTSKLLVGANKSELYEAGQGTIYPYWGMDANGNLLISNDLDNSTNVTINSMTCIDFIGPLYTCSIAEIRLAMMGQQAWINYIAQKRLDIAVRLGLASQYDDTLLQSITTGESNPNSVPPTTLQSFSPDYAKSLAMAKRGDRAYNNAARLHRLVSNAGQQHYGKTFVVQLPMILQKVDLETQTITNSHDIDSEGGYSEGLNPLGLNEINKVLFERSMNKLECFGYFEYTDIDPITSASSTSIMQSNGAYVKAQVDGYIHFTPFPCVIVNFSQPIMRKSAFYPAYLDEYIENVLPINTTTGRVDPNLSLFLSSNMVPTAGQSMVPPHLMPTAINIPIRNNIFTYGPWWLNGAVAQTEFEKDDNLAPWNYGGIFNMNLAAYNKLFASATNLVISESGEFEEAGTPQFSLGDLLLAQGSNITGIDVNIGKGGATTSYRLRTFDYRYMGAFSKKQEERLARIGRGVNNIRNRVRDIFQKIYDNVVVIHQAYLDGCHPALNPKTPHSILYGCEYNFSDRTGYVEVGTMTPSDAMVLSDPRASNSDKFQRTSVMSTNGFFRPFSTKPDDSVMSSFSIPLTGTHELDTPNAISLNPFKYKNDILVYSRGTKFTQDMKSFDYNHTTQKLDYNRQSQNADDVRAMGLRGPLIITGYGFNIYGKSVVDTYRRNGDWESARGTIQDDDRADILAWRAGPVDLLWDDLRGVWTPHTFVLGTVTVRAASGQTGKMWVRSSSNNEVSEIPFYNPWSRPVEVDELVASAYFPHQNRFCIVSANC